MRRHWTYVPGKRLPRATSVSGSVVSKLQIAVVVRADTIFTPVCLARWIRGAARSEALGLGPIPPTRTVSFLSRALGADRHSPERGREDRPCSFETVVRTLSEPGSL